jgi:hypothetical protein
MGRTMVVHYDSSSLFGFCITNLGLDFVVFQAESFIKGADFVMDRKHDGERMVGVPVSSNGFHFSYITTRQWRPLAERPGLMSSVSYDWVVPPDAVRS